MPVSKYCTPSDMYTLGLRSTEWHRDTENSEFNGVAALKAATLDQGLVKLGGTVDLVT